MKPPSTGQPPNHEAQPAYWQDHRLLLGLIAAYVLAGYAVDWTGLVPGMMSRMNYRLGYLITPLLILSALPVALFVTFGRRLQERERKMGKLTWLEWTEAWTTCRGEVLNSRRVASVATVAVAMPIFLTAFGNWKSAIPVLQPFAWDREFRDLDAVIHFGHQPWLLLQVIIGNPEVTNWIDYFYGWWVLLVPVALTWQAWSHRWVLRRRFFISVALVWGVLGTLAAISLSSAGPCFYERLNGDGEAYRQMMEYLRAVHSTHGLFAVETQDLLWEVYLGGSANPFLRISAMPSVHVAFAGLCAILGWTTNRLLGLIFTAYALLILVGSIHLGWHYAVDGYVSLLALGPIWWAAGRLAGDPARGKTTG